MRRNLSQRRTQGEGHKDHVLIPRHQIFVSRKNKSRKGKLAKRYQLYPKLLVNYNVKGQKYFGAQVKVYKRGKG